MVTIMAKSSKINSMEEAKCHTITVGFTKVNGGKERKKAEEYSMTNKVALKDIGSTTKRQDTESILKIK